MSGRHAREIRKAAKQSAELAGQLTAPAIEVCIEYTRGVELRVEALEKRGETFLGRLKWLLRG